MPLPLADKKNRVKKILIYGNPGTGKTTGAELYCKKNGLNPIVLDVDDTNFTDMPNLRIDFTQKSQMIRKHLLHWIPKIHTDYDTIVIDGISSLIELLTPPDDKKNGFIPFKVRADNFKKLINCLNKSKCNLIFIGQSDVIIKDTAKKDDSETYSKPIVQINSLVNTSFYTYKSEGLFKYECTKWRGEKEALC